jgi:hypothetical protein
VPVDDTTAVPVDDTTAVPVDDPTAAPVALNQPEGASDPRGAGAPAGPVPVSPSAFAGPTMSRELTAFLRKAPATPPASVNDDGRSGRNSGTTGRSGGMPGEPKLPPDPTGPSAPPSAAGTSGGPGNASFFTCFAALVAAIGFGVMRRCSRRMIPSVAEWHPISFVSLPERPG